MREREPERERVSVGARAAPLCLYVKKEWVDIRSCNSTVPAGKPDKRKCFKRCRPKQTKGTAVQKNLYFFIVVSSNYCLLARNFSVFEELKHTDFRAHVQLGQSKWEHISSKTGCNSGI